MCIVKPLKAVMLGRLALNVDKSGSIAFTAHMTPPQAQGCGMLVAR